MNIISSAPTLPRTDRVISKTQKTSAVHTVKINSKKIVIILSCITALLVVASIIGDYLLLHYPADNIYVKRYVDFFYLSNENSLPTLFSAMLLFVASLLNFAIYNIAANDLQKKKMKYYWFLLGLIFTFLGLDESLQIHDMISNADVLQNTVEQSNRFLYYGWVVPYLAGVLIVGFFFLRFVFSLPVNIRNRFIIAGFIYVGGALGFEFIESYVHVTLGDSNILQKVLITVEETMEMVGVITFIYALLDYIQLAKVRFEINKND